MLTLFLYDRVACYYLRMRAFPFKQVVVLFNPASTHTRSAKKRIEELRQLVPAPQFLLLETSTKGRSANIDNLLRHEKLLGPETVLCIAAGDGTVNMAIEALLFHASARARQTVLLPLWGGNANDVAHMLNGPAYRMPVRTLFEKGKIVSVRPLRCELVSRRGSVKNHLAVGYASFGATALAARGLNGPPHRDSRLHRFPGGRVIQEVMTVFQAFIKAPSFRIYDDAGPRSIYDRMFINGSRIGKIRPLPLKLTDDAYYATTVSEKRLGAALAKARELLRRPSVEKAADTTVFRCMEQAWAQFDGEPVKLAAGTTVHVARAPEAFRAWSVRLTDKH